jgi:hypothetical protein
MGSVVGSQCRAKHVFASCQRLSNSWHCNPDQLTQSFANNQKSCWSFAIRNVTLYCANPHVRSIPKYQGLM